MRTDTAAARGSAAVHRVLEAELAGARARGVDRPRVVDVGGGSGVWAVPFASAGCLVTVVEPNPNALATLRRRAEESGVADRITVVADDSDALGTHVPPGSADLVLAHGLLEVVDDPAPTVAALAATAVPGGAVSVLAANRFAAVLHRALAGRVAEARRLLAAPDGVLGEDGETLLRRLDRDRLTGLLTNAGLEVALLQGDGVISDAMQGVPRDTVDAADEVAAWEGELVEFEDAAAGIPPLRDIASRLHALARRPG
ncbi:Methyltransferase domain-containing protein [Amycolatopsis arida]|uniref:Methyltransferase domain-containing protein n=1 Tax=Amycolatopsis arida TaxID=587909 RepID=A0A1I5VHC6_9PSEU|nr:methyltransferase domain-containing protein [Amycolatopsis arida]TDX87881.1 methyltransferase family protein [Amycolatopsis arida]SFQ06782.1 Methyltransferase domain-containing protein [Amycolatopsis arida]